MKKFQICEEIFEFPIFFENFEFMENKKETWIIRKQGKKRKRIK